VRDAAAVARALDRVDVVFHAAAKVGIGLRELDEFRAVNVEGSRTVASAARRAGVRMLHVSSVDTLGFGTREQPATEERRPEPQAAVPYLISKREAEAAVLEEHAAGLDVVIVNPVYVLGPWDWKPSSGRMLLEIARGASRLAPPGGNDFAHAEDVARGILAAADRGRSGERYILGGEALSYREAFELFARITGGPRPLLTVPGPLVTGAGGFVSGISRLGLEPLFNRGSALLSILPHHFDDGKARRELGYDSRSARVAAEDAWRWLKSSGYRT
jgi:dihydroflavonol-4-reductase